MIFKAVLFLAFLVGIPVQAQTIDDALAGCPTAAEVAGVNEKLSLSFEFDSTAPVLVCSAGSGSSDLTEMMRRIYKLILALPRLTAFDAPLPWTGATYTDWLYNFSGLRGIRFRQDIQTSSCCDPVGVINVGVASPTGIDYFRDMPPVWADPVRGGFGSNLMSILTHEARHINFGGHSCGDSDRLLDELGPWGTQFSMSLWLANHSDPSYFRPTHLPPGTSGPEYYRDWERRLAEEIRETRICIDDRTIRTIPVFEFFNSMLGHYFLTAEPLEVQSIADGNAGPGWTLTGRYFNAYPSSAEARDDAVPVWRFYGTPGIGPNSHFYTADPAEYAAVRLDPGWTFEGVAFYAGSAGPGSCAFSHYDDAVLPPVYRLYNNRFAFNDSNHRFTADSNVYSQMQVAPWTGEGRVFCAAP
jgi:uncharacterized protein DUF5648